MGTVGVIVPVEEIMPMQRQKWLSLEKSPYYALANPFTGSDSELLTAGKTLLEQGADVLVLDCLGYYQHHRDVLQKPLMFRFCCRMCWFPDWRQNYWSNVLISRDRGKERPYIEPLTDDQKGLFMLQSNEYFDGKVKSIGFTSSSTGRASVGVMAEGNTPLVRRSRRDDGSQRGAECPAAG